jgi:hypothetical protein
VSHYSIPKSSVKVLSKRRFRCICYVKNECLQQVEYGFCQTFRITCSRDVKNTSFMVQYISRLPDICFTLNLAIRGNCYAADTIVERYTIVSILKTNSEATFNVLKRFTFFFWRMPMNPLIAAVKGAIEKRAKNSTFKTAKAASQ